MMTGEAVGGCGADDRVAGALVPHEPLFFPLFEKRQGPSYYGFSCHSLAQLHTHTLCTSYIHTYTSRSPRINVRRK
jgi:hypothetical protein